MASPFGIVAVRARLGDRLALGSSAVYSFLAALLAILVSSAVAL